MVSVDMVDDEAPLPRNLITSALLKIDAHNYEYDTDRDVCLKFIKASTSIDRWRTR